jgi:hypothetical protein
MSKPRVDRRFCESGALVGFAECRSTSEVDVNVDGTPVGLCRTCAESHDIAAMIDRCQIAFVPGHEDEGCGLAAEIEARHKGRAVVLCLGHAIALSTALDPGSARRIGAS